jgi:hypothetical protein
MSVQPTSEKCTVPQLAASAAEAEDGPSVSAQRAVARANVVKVVFIIV